MKYRIWNALEHKFHHEFFEYRDLRQNFGDVNLFLAQDGTVFDLFNPDKPRERDPEKYVVSFSFAQGIDEQDIYDGDIVEWPEERKVKKQHGVNAGISDIVYIKEAIRGEVAIGNGTYYIIQKTWGNCYGFNNVTQKKIESMPSKSRLFYNNIGHHNFRWNDLRVIGNIWENPNLVPEKFRGVK